MQCWEIAGLRGDATGGRERVPASFLEDTVGPSELFQEGSKGFSVIHPSP